MTITELLDPNAVLNDTLDTLRRTYLPHGGTAGGYDLSDYDTDDEE